MTDPWGVQWHPAIPSARGCACPSCGKLKMVTPGSSERQQSWFDAVIGFSRSVPPTRACHGRCYGGVMLECPYCHTYFWLHVSDLLSLQQYARYCPDWPALK